MEQHPLLHFPTYAETFLKIVTKDSRLVPFHLNHYQLKLVDLIEKQRAMGKPARIIVLKSRQVGLSTVTCGYMYHRAATGFLQKVMTVAHDIQSTNNLFLMMKRMYDHSPDIVKPLKRYSNSRELTFEQEDELLRKDEPGLMSSIVVQTAGTKTAGRSSTIQHLHISELAFWENASETLSGLLQALSKDPASTCVIESTPCGIDGPGKEFYERWKAAEEGRSDFIPFFVPWWTVDTYRAKYPAKDLSAKEKELKGQFPIDDYQLAWRRDVIANDMNNDHVLFDQEYPSDTMTAFISSGRSVFDLAMLMKMINNIPNDNYQEGYIAS